jgi:uncharacterized membrane protein
MKTSIKQNRPSRSLFARVGKLATALAFGGFLCTFPMSSVFAARHGGGGGHGGGHASHGGYHGGYHGGGHWGGGYYYGGPDVYAAPEPYAYGPAPCYGPYEDCGPPPPSGINLFFGL